MLALFASSAYAADAWEHVVTSATGNKFYVRNVEKKGDIYQFWLKIDNPPLSECKNIQDKSPACDKAIEEHPIASMTYKAQINCKTSKSKSLDNIVYGRRGDTIGMTSETGKEKWETIFPDTTSEGMLKRLCK